MQLEDLRTCGARFEWLNGEIQLVAHTSMRMFCLASKF